MVIALNGPVFLKKTRNNYPGKTSLSDQRGLTTILYCNTHVNW